LSYFRRRMTFTAYSAIFRWLCDLSLWPYDWGCIKITVKNRQNHGVVLKKWGKSRHNHGLQFTVQYALFYCILITNYHCSHAAPFGASRRKILKYYRTKKMQWKSSIILSLVFGEWADAVPLTIEVMQLLIAL